MNKFINKAGVTAIVLVITAYNSLPVFVKQVVASEAGETIKAGLKATNDVAKLDPTPLPALIGNLIKALLGVVGIVFLVYTVIGGIIYMTAGGDDGKKVTKAKDMIKNALIGLIIVVVAYSLTSFVITTISDATAGGGADKKG